MEQEKILIDKTVLNKKFNIGTVIPGIKVYQRAIVIKKYKEQKQTSRNVKLYRRPKRKYLQLQPSDD